MKTIALINEQTNICDNICVDDRPLAEIQIPGYIVLDLASTPFASWRQDEQTSELVLVDGENGCGGIGCTYENGKLIAPKQADLPAPFQQLQA